MKSKEMFINGIKNTIFFFWRY